jgi:serine protease Do
VATGRPRNSTPTGDFRIDAADLRHRSSKYTIAKTSIPYPSTSSSIGRSAAELADALHLETTQGALISAVTSKGPADEAGLERSDVIVRFGDKPIEKMRELPRAVASTAPGTKVAVEVIRDGKRVKKTVEVAKLEEEKGERAQAEKPAPSDDRGSTAFGFDIADVPDEMRQPGQKGGAVITRVYPGGPADTAGLQVGDVIEEVDRKPVKDGMDAEKKLIAASDKALLAIQRDGGALLVVVKRGK